MYHLPLPTVVGFPISTNGDGVELHTCTCIVLTQFVNDDQLYLSNVANWDFGEAGVPAPAVCRDYRSVKYDEQYEGKYIYEHLDDSQSFGACALPRTQPEWLFLAAMRVRVIAPSARGRPE